MIEINKKYGCLTVLDLGEEYLQTEKYLSYLEERESLINENILYQTISNSSDCIKKIKLIEEYPSSSFASDLKTNPSDIDRVFSDFVRHRVYFNNQKLQKMKPFFETHYKCQCKCGRFQYYNAKTIESNPRYCFYPVPISTRSTRSTRASNATYRKREKYADLECVVLRDKSECIPSDDYCDYYNAYKIKRMTKTEENLRLEIDRLPRVYAKNYDIDFTGRQYESLYIEECCNEHAETIPDYHFSQKHSKVWDRVTVYKQYRCKCLLCGKEKYVSCDSFGIFPPTEYGSHAYNGYWSKVFCDCHPISSFQWIVNKLLFENNVHYLVEYSFPDLLGYFRINQLRFDFAVLNEDGTLKCLIECQGKQHFMPVKEFGGKKQYELQEKNDELKREYVQRHNLRLIEISYKDKQYEIVEAILKRMGLSDNTLRPCFPHG